MRELGQYVSKPSNLARASAMVIGIGRLDDGPARITDGEHRLARIPGPVPAGVRRRRAPARGRAAAARSKDSIEDILITLGKHYHIIRPIASKPGLFLDIVLDKSRCHLALARRKVADVEGALTIWAQRPSGTARVAARRSRRCRDR